ncbi:carboxymuconolactone decarboxylase family protein [Marinicella litoralis]|uniref:Putative peroxidase-related enzyme n=1 Tax=Marinicella litoralis TaxID=644220 RepID=A0A4R6XK23_9GAMM|nr:peroxidase-related enzyme [Marinicella litoralis]TDR16318.1 putative peroxidase-related enzyme [Marinicella litoralis]
MTWIKTIPYELAEDNLLKLYNQVKGPDNNVDNIMLAHSLRPHTMQGHMTLYKYTLHHPKNKISKWFLECIGIYVSMLNQCQYCVDHHFAGMNRLLNDQNKATLIKQELLNRNHQLLNNKQQVALDYVKQLTLSPASLSKEWITKMHKESWTDGQILEINQVAAYFNYANRTVLGLGVHSEGDIIGLSPNNSDDPDDWNHR